MYTQADSEAFLDKFFEDLDSKDVSRLRNHFTNDAVIKAADNEIRGIEAIVKHFTGIHAMMHQVHKQIRADPVQNGLAIYSIIEVHLTVLNRPDEPIILPACAYFVRVPPGEEEAGKIKELTIYEDFSDIKALLMKGPK